LNKFIQVLLAKTYKRFKIFFLSKQITRKEKYHWKNKTSPQQTKPNLGSKGEKTLP